MNYHIYWVGNEVVSFFFHDFQTEKSAMTLLPTQYFECSDNLNKLKN